MLIHRLILKRAAKAWKKAPGAAVPTICVGNITVGGTGKTPHTEMILRLLQEAGRSGLAVLSRGYKRKSKGFQTVQVDSTAAFAGDEPLQIKRKFPAVDVAVDKNRVEGCAKLVESGASLIVLDDAFQYKKLHASLNVVLVNSHRPIFEDRLLPFGRLRDLPSRIADADVVIVSKCPREMEAEERGALFRGRGFDPSVGAHELSHIVRRESVSRPVSLSVPDGTIQREPPGGPGFLSSDFIVDQLNSLNQIKKSFVGPDAKRAREALQSKMDL